METNNTQLDNNNNNNHNNKNTSEVHKSFLDTLKKELSYLGMLLIAVIIIFQVVYYKESLVNNLKTILTLYWLLVIPGYFILSYWYDELEFLERFVFGMILAIGVLGILSYFTGFLGFHVKYHGYVYPVIIDAVGFYLSWKKHKSPKSKESHELHKSHKSH